MNIPEHKQFHTKDGKKAKNIIDLRNIINSMSQEDFSHHITEDRNDFANWTRDILHKDSLAEKMEKVNTKEELQELLKDELAKEHAHTKHKEDEFKRFLYKEFLIGFLLGLIIGIIAMRLLG